MRIAVAGGTGVLGSHVVRALEDDGHETVVLSRGRGTDVRTGDGLAEALAGTHAVVDALSVTTIRRRAAVDFFAATTRNLLAAGAAAGVRHHVAVSVVGCDVVDYGYYLGKRAQEALVTTGTVPWTVLRATQFHEFAGQVVDASPGPVALVPRMASQPVAAAEVGGVVARIAAGAPAGQLQMGGPELHDIPDLARRQLRAEGRRRLVVPVRLPGAVGRQMASGALVPDEPTYRGTTTYDAWLSDRSGP
ncbi:3-beta hydroxysteroid dehydrogenase/isomerase family protein [Aeromicrobium marinum DSM 15272]|uniref:3-beta hydroxysteroid dehydrogenase/isomerase family protein n=1 Tax=Aeromicrobium marinum DSM 15272 TaxID=585531 RepID=E2SBA8_9ACTN|nr:NAD(P)H-binding protein [Aeromicrobium marinum]EFQ83654.1 3-beta hydroxysteroid dehydrogenase/isomerase family protein [Aeromicrobium marinum DSM 15272]